ncbi:tyrosine-type recombinase/integrase [Skermania sp. ID1734]|uniref:tyrosine-type recombinase/integrase n=1 Tax=Skermania sp. ID1734 TaxID=2597516 RepID=UPI00117DB163|nr:tyrosine-type recombinase/integrase [Skermania sp. ID1734]TSD94596.1 tyrosine-type recombinase/integrase [Skermania sp. ID1734]
MAEKTCSDPDLAGLLSSFVLALRAERKSPKTIESYLIGVRLFLTWCADTGHPAVLDKPTVRGFLVHLDEDLDQADATLMARFRALRAYAKWLVAEDELDADPLASMKPPKLEQKVRPPLTEDELKALIKACNGKRFVDRRDEALVRLLAETGLRAGEALAVELSGVDLVRGTVIVMGKGGRGRVVGYGPNTAVALDRYMRMRRAHRHADRPQLWLGGLSQGFTYQALHKTLQARAAAAGIADFHSHRLRRTAATRWLKAGGSEQGLMAMAGWKTRAMLDRYTEYTAQDRALEEARALNLGDL